MTTPFDQIGHTYAGTRRADPRIAHLVAGALGPSSTVLNVGAGTGSYEPRERFVVAVDPSQVMLRQRSADAASCLCGVAEALPFPPATFDAAMAAVTIHHWSDPAAGLHEMRRVAARQVLLLCESSHRDWMWLTDDYLPGLEDDAHLAVSSVEFVDRHLDVRDVVVVPVPADCADGFGGAFWARPEQYLDPAVRAGISLFQLAPPGVVDDGMQRLAADLADGTWDRKYGHLRHVDALDLGYRIVIAGS